MTARQPAQPVNGAGVPAGDPRLAKLSLNQRTTKSWSVREAVEGCVRAGISAIGLWREPVAEIGVAAAAKIVTDAGMRVSSLCRGGFLTTAGDEGRAALDDNRRAIDEAAGLGTDCLVMVVGGLPPGSRDLRGARRRMAEAVAELAPYAGERGVRLALEPLHPMYCADRAVLSTLGQALDLAEQFPVEQVGVVVDTFHVWWDPDVWTQIARAGARIASFQVCDFLTPLPADVLLGRGMMGDGHIEFPPFRRAVAQAGYTGDTEVEIFNAQVWATDPGQVLATMKERYIRLVLEG
ncbi:sugar phosphate isomerase/epimerase family protein [Microtetraspora sp. NBRC 16547]|uniref:sugar phosphate isomerase/epimerase family protein n=1 Tax=Microtetraspora sp. NBRC 16547 TaxID=3030993 RepID=UPI0024A2A743|nr:sugar phosphate isomerase/epimerase family protein [Microtetraspora sp. NBRC 16547]GLW99285.1 3-dehydroshikimate dehydratase [Microtetraspora sp. NBRC 16547]